MCMCVYVCVLIVLFSLPKTQYQVKSKSATPEKKGVPSKTVQYQKIDQKKKNKQTKQKTIQTLAHHEKSKKTKQKTKKVPKKNTGAVPTFSFLFFWFLG